MSLRKTKLLSPVTIEYVAVWPPPLGVKIKRQSIMLSGRLSRSVSPVQPAANSVWKEPERFEQSHVSEPVLHSIVVGQRGHLKATQDVGSALFVVVRSQILLRPLL